MKRSLMMTAAAVVLVALAGCKPAHYLVICDDYHDAGEFWQLVYVDKRDGYILGCAWRNPENGETRSRTCTWEGC
jgi:hypothetical protein